MDVTQAQMALTTTASPSGNGVISADFDTFLKMLTTQMQNQDPLNPIDSADYAVQLATFSGVEQQMKTNQLLEGLGAQFGLLGMAQLAGWVGQEARVAAPVWKEEGPVTLAPNPAKTADRAVLVVRDDGGALVTREDLPASTAPYDWFGADAAGNPLPRGLYTLTLESWSGEDLLGTTEVEAYARIVEVRGGPSGTSLVLQGGVEVAAANVTALRQPT